MVENKDLTLGLSSLANVRGGADLKSKSHNYYNFINWFL